MRLRSTARRFGDEHSMLSSSGSDPGPGRCAIDFAGPLQHPRTRRRMRNESASMNRPRRERFAGAVDLDAVRMERARNPGLRFAAMRSRTGETGRTLSVPGLSIFVTGPDADLEVSAECAVLCAGESRL